jgi:putative Ig domain-containing protein
VSLNPRSASTPARLVRGALVVLATTVALMGQLPADAAPPPPVVDDSAVPDPMTAQVSDAVVPATFTATTSGSPSALSASTTGLPAGLAVSAPTPTSGAASWTISGSPTVAPGVYPVLVTVTDPASGSDEFEFDVDVLPEDASVAYTGPTTVVGPDWDADEVPLTMTAQVTQAADGALGAISAATVRFTDTLTGEVLCAAAPVVTGGTGPGTASCPVLADVFDEDQVTFHVALTVGGSYVGRSAADATVTVYLPEEPDPVLPDTVITSGPSGWLLETKGTFAFASTMPDSDTDFYCRLDAAKVPCKGSPVTLTGLSQRSHRFSVVAENEDGDADETAATRDFAVPLDDAALKSTGKWKRKHDAGSYLDTYSQAQKKGVALSYKVAGVRELALFVQMGKKYGAVKVYLDGALLKTVKTAGKGGSKSIRLGHFTSDRSGLVKIVTTSGRPVRIDGLGVSTTTF